MLVCSVIWNIGMFCHLKYWYVLSFKILVCSAIWKLIQEVCDLCRLISLVRRGVNRVQNILEELNVPQKFTQSLLGYHIFLCKFINNTIMSFLIKIEHFNLDWNRGRQMIGYEEEGGSTLLDWRNAAVITVIAHNIFTNTHNIYSQKDLIYIQKKT